MIAETPRVPLSDEQAAAVETIITNGEDDAILTGKAGSGKSTSVRELQSRVPVFVSALTAVAALNVRGCTVDRLFCIDRTKWTYYNDYNLAKNMSKVPRRIVIDECSMIGTRMAELIFNAARKFDKQLILVGDFAQAAPVKDEFAVTSPLFMNANLLNLKENHRQGAGEYLDALNQVRVGEVDDMTRRVFSSRIQPLPEDDDQTMRLYATRALADARNQAMLARISAPSFNCKAEFNDLRGDYIREKWPMKADQVQSYIDASPMANNKSFKIGARVMITLNIYQSDAFGTENQLRFVNGDLGTIVDILDRSGRSLAGERPSLGNIIRPAGFMIQLDRKKDEPPELLSTVDMPIYGVEKTPMASISGFPLTLGYAVTIHKCQGLTLPKCYVDIQSITHHPADSRHGLAYVALSRVRNLENLYLSNWTDDAVFCHPAIRRFVQP